MALRKDLAIDFYADESSQSGHRFLVLGVLSAFTANVPAIEREYSQLRRKHNLNSELKWKKTTDQKFDAYRDWTELFFKLAAARSVRFQAMVVDTTQFDHKTYNEGDGEIGFNKMLYQLLLHRIGRLYRGVSPLNGYLDSRTTKHAPERLRQMLNAGLARHHQIDTAPFRKMVFRDSKGCDLIQTVDILTGAIAFERNQHALKMDTRQSKKDLSKIIFTTSIQKPIKWQFKIWDFEFKKKVPQA